MPRSFGFSHKQLVNIFYIHRKLSKCGKPNSLVIVNPETRLLITTPVFASMAFSHGVYTPVFINHGMLSAKICAVGVGRNPFRITQNFKSLGSLCLWCSKSTQAASQEVNFDLGDSTEIEDHGEVRPFDDIPGPKRSLQNLIAFYRRSEGLTKTYKNSQALFKEYGPIFKSNFTEDMLIVHILDPDDYKKVFRAEGKYPQRPPLDFWVEHRKRRNYFRGLVHL